MASTGLHASVSISHLYGFKRHRTDLCFTVEDTTRPGCGPRGRVGSASARSPGPAASVSSPSRRTEQKEASGFTGPRSASTLGLDLEAGVRSTPQQPPQQLWAVLSVFTHGVSQNKSSQPPQFWSPTGVQAPFLRPQAAWCVAALPVPPSSRGLPMKPHPAHLSHRRPASRAGRQRALI